MKYVLLEDMKNVFDYNKPRWVVCETEDINRIKDVIDFKVRMGCSPANLHIMSVVDFEYKSVIDIKEDKDDP